MSYRKIFIRNKSYLSYQNNSLKIKIDNNDFFISFDDIDTIIFETQQSTLTSALLSELSKSNINVIFSDKKFMPTSILLGINKNSRASKIQKAQIKLTNKIKKRVWQTIIQNKINNQAMVLKNCKKEYEYLESLVLRVNLDDKENIEAIAAAYYFKELFGNEFVRREDNSINVALNYGYTVLRSSICRYLVAYGLNPAFGIHHSSELNSFNLADDIIEIYRPIIDEYVFNNVHYGLEIDKYIKNDLLKLLERRFEYKNKEFELNEILKKYIANYQSICLGKSNELAFYRMT